MVAAVVVLLAGCGVRPGLVGSSTVSSAVVVRLHGSVHGGQQPVSGATIQLYAVGTTGDGSPATAMLTQTVLSDSNGEFSITNDYACPASGPTTVYLSATGGNPGLAAGTNNAALSMMTALGDCGSLTPSTYIVVNELTTVGAVAALAPFMTSAVGVGSAGSDVPALSAAFTLASQYVNTATGTAPGVGVPTGATVPVTELNTLADIVASCVNSSGGVAGDGSACGNLFALTTPAGGAAPADTVMALLDMMENPALNTSGLFGLAPAESPFQPTLSGAPANFAVQFATGSTLTISPSWLNFASTMVGTLAASQQVVLSNTGQAVVSFSGSALVGANAGDFSVSNNCGGGSLAIGGSCTFTVGYQPAATGARNATLQIVSNGLTTSVPITGQGNVSFGTSLPTPLADYSFLDGVGSMLSDGSGNGNNGTLMSGANAPTWTSSGLSFNGNAGNVQGVSLPATLNSARTFLFVTSTQNLTNNSQYSFVQYDLLLSNSSGYNGLNLWDQQRYTGQGTYLTSSPGISANGKMATTIPSNTNGFHCKAFTLGTGYSDLDHIYVDGVEASAYSAQSFSAGVQSGGNFFLGSSDVAPWTTGNYAGTFYRARIYAQELSAQQVHSSCAGMVADVASRGVATGPVNVAIATPTLQAIGDSIVCGYSDGNGCILTPFMNQLTLANQPAYTISNWGVPGAEIEAISASEPYRVAERCRSTGGPVIALVLAGTNEFLYTNTTPAAAVGFLTSEVKTLKSAGCKVYVGTIPSIGHSLDADKDSYDTLIVQQWQTMGADGVIDFAANPLIGADGAYSNSTYFQGNGVHPTQAGQNLMAVAMSNSLNYYYGSTVANPHVVACSTAYTMASGDGVVTAAPTSACALTLPDCTGPSGAQYVINNPQSVYPVTLMGGASQPINGSTSPVTVPANGSVMLTDVPNAKTAGGCGWQM